MSEAVVLVQYPDKDRESRWVSAFSHYQAVSSLISGRGVRKTDRFMITMAHYFLLSWY